LHLTVHYIKALENDAYHKLPGTTFVKGYIRAYARFLNLDVNEVLAIYERNNVSAETLGNSTESPSRNRRRHDQTFRWAVVTAVIIVAGILAGWWFVGKDQTPARAAASTQQLPAESLTDRAATTLTVVNRPGVAIVAETDVAANNMVVVAQSANTVTPDDNS
jgi:cytoskeleton protein RodZ